MPNAKNKKIIFVLGGVVSSLGKGIVSSSLGCLLSYRNIKVFNLKCDPYLNIDPGTMNPTQHGEVFVTKDGAETDLDLGHYERFIGNELSKASNFTAGRIYQTVLQKERNGDFLGQTIQTIPHITNEIKRQIYLATTSTDADVTIIEFGGTIGDIELNPFVEACRQIINELGKENVFLVLVTLAPFLKANKELKTKPTQNAVKNLGALCLQPDAILIRTEKEIDQNDIKKISLFCNIDEKNVIEAIDLDSIYKVPLNLHNKNFDKIVCDKLGFRNKINLKPWKKFLNKINESKTTLKIAIVGKYTALADAYLSVIESLKLSAYEIGCIPQVSLISSKTISSKNVSEKLKGFHAIIVPGGFGDSGIEGKIETIKYCREKDVPFLGICLGMQLSVVEFCRNVLKIEDANSSEWSNTSNPVINLIEGKNSNKNLGGTLRLGNYECSLLKNSLARKLYGKSTINERHRHRYEVNNDYVEKIIKHGMVFSGIYKEKGLMEIAEIPDKTFFIASQFHPEFTSKPNNPNPLFLGLLKAAKIKYFD